MKKNTWMTWLLALMWLPIASVANAGWSVVTDATPTQTTGVKGETTAYSWGETYQLTDGGNTYTVIKVTKAGEGAKVTVPAETPIEMLVVGGGGAGGACANNSNRGGGGGAGGLVWKSVIFGEETELTLTVGAGGKASGTASVVSGSDSTVAAGGVTLIQAFGGGGGGSGTEGADGGSGGGGSVNGKAGGSARNSGGDLATGIGEFGFAGGTANSSNRAGGGGGAGGAGENGTAAGNGGPGLVYAITGAKEGYAGGGGGAPALPAENGGKVTIDGVDVYLGGFGYSGTYPNKESHNARVPNSGSGGGGASVSYPSGDGADGIIVLRYIPPVDTRIPVDKPEITGAQFAYDGENHKPIIEAETGWTVSYSASAWVEIGDYTVTITLEKGYKWSDNTTDALTINYLIYDLNAPVWVVAGAKPTDSTGVKGKTTDYSWGETYELTDNKDGKIYTIVKVTNTVNQVRGMVSVTVPAETPIEMLVVGGGGAGSGYTSNRGAGGGAGGLVWSNLLFSAETELDLTVGTGGTTSGANGTDSTVVAGVMTIMQAFGGGGGGTSNSSPGREGGSGGGNAVYAAGTAAGAAKNTGGDLTTLVGEFGSAGGQSSGNGNPAGGGGGAGGAGGNGTSDLKLGGQGGAGLVYAITGAKEGYAAGGSGSPLEAGGEVITDEGTITIGGRAYSSTYPNKEDHHAVANTGSGGGGASSDTFGDGADGIIVLRYIPPVDTRTPVDKPEIAGAKFAYDGADHKPVITPEEGWTVSYSAEAWVEIGTYTVTVALKDGYKWSDDTSAPLLINYSIYDPNAIAPVEGEPTTTLGIVYQPSMVMTDWGYRYTLVDRETADAFTVIVVTNARQNVALDIPALATVETLVVGGGGAGGEVDGNRPRGGGGGAGGLVWGKYFYPTAKIVTLRVGAGGAVAGESGGNSTIEIAGEALVTAHGGGGGGGETAPKSGGSGGGGAPPSYVTGAAAGDYPGELANAGGNAASAVADDRAGGGGGAGGVGGTGVYQSYGGAGGAGLAYAITGELKGYAAGGGASPSGTGGMVEGVVIGGAGFSNSDERWLVAKHAVANTGSGGGGGGTSAGQVAGTGASGIIVLRYANVNQKFKLEENAQGELEAVPVAGLTFYLFR